MSIRGTKRAEALTFNVLVVAILCILVLIVLAVMFINRSDKASKIIDDCGIGSFCVPNKAACDGLGGFGNAAKCELNDESERRLGGNQGQGQGTYCCRIFDADIKGASS